MQFSDRHMVFNYGNGTNRSNIDIIQRSQIQTVDDKIQRHLYRYNLRLRDHTNLKAKHLRDTEFLHRRGNRKKPTD